MNPYDNESSDSLFQQWRDGDREVGDALIKRHADRLRVYFLSTAGDETEDLVQDTFARLIESMPRFKGLSSFLTFLFGIARHVRLEHFRQRHNFEPMVDLVDEHASSLPDSLVEHRILLDNMAKLPIYDQELLELRYWQDLSASELAAVLEATPEAVRSQLFRARRRLHSLIINAEGAAQWQNEDILDEKLLALRRAIGV